MDYHHCVKSTTTAVPIMLMMFPAVCNTYQLTIQQQPRSYCVGFWGGIGEIVEELHGLPPWASSMERHGVPRPSTGGHGAPSTFQGAFRGVPWGSMEFFVIPREAAWHSAAFHSICHVGVVENRGNLRGKFHVKYRLAHSMAIFSMEEALGGIPWLSVAFYAPPP